MRILKFLNIFYYITKIRTIQIIIKKISPKQEITGKKEQSYADKSVALIVVTIFRVKRGKWTKCSNSDLPRKYRDHKHKLE